MSETIPTEFETPQASPGFLLWTVTSRWQRQIRQALEPHNLTHAQFVLLASLGWLLQHETEISQSRLAEHTHIDPMTTSQVLRTLEQKGWVERHPHPRDTRARVLQVTPAGQQLIQQALPAIEAVDRAFFGEHTSEALRVLRRL